MAYRRVTPTDTHIEVASGTARRFTVGFKAALAQSVVGFASIFIPLNDDGLRSDAVPTAGLEVSF